MTSALRELRARLLEPVDIAWLTAFRALFGVTLCVSMLRFIAYGWVEELFVQPRFHFKYWGLGWVEPLSASGMHALFWALAGLALCVAVGFAYRLTLSLFALGFGYLQAIDVSNYLNHYYLALLLALLLLAAPANRAFSLDAALGVVRRREHVARAWIWLFRMQVGVVYTFAGLAKAHADWLFHAEPLSIWLAGRSDLPLVGYLVSRPYAPHFMSWAGFLFDSSIPWLLLWRRTRPIAYVLVLAFHLATRALFPIGMFPVIMALAALVFFSPSYPRKLLRYWVARELRYLVARERRVKSGKRQPAPRAVAHGLVPGVPTTGASPRVHWALVLAAGYCALQVLLPLRFLAYGGNVRWHEQGMRFSWRVMVREKNGAVTFVVRQTASGREFHVSPRRYLTRLQEREMSSQPDLILQLAHHIHDDFARRGLGDVEVRADSWVSLNGRRMARLVDPEVDLTTVRDGLARAHWILPAPETPPLRLRVSAARSNERPCKG